VGALDVLNLAGVVKHVRHLVVDEEVGGAGSLHPALEERLILVGEDSLNSLVS